MRTNHCKHKKTTEIFFIHVNKPRKTPIFLRVESKTNPDQVQHCLSRWHFFPSFSSGISSSLYLKYRCWDGLERVMIQRSIRLKGSKCVLRRSATAAVIGESPVTGLLGFYMLKNTSRCGFDEFLPRAWRECRRQNRRQAQVQPVWFGSKNMKLSVFNQFGFILG